MDPAGALHIETEYTPLAYFKALSDKHWTIPGHSAEGRLDDSEIEKGKKSICLQQQTTQIWRAVRRGSYERDENLVNMSECYFPSNLCLLLQIVTSFWGMLRVAMATPLCTAPMGFVS